LWCDALNLSRSAYYHWLRSPYGRRARQDEAIRRGMQRIDQIARGRYGYRAMHVHLHADGIACGRDRVLRLMRELSLTVLPRRKFKPQGTNSKHGFGYHPNLLKGLAVTRRDQVWVADTTYLPSQSGFFYQATVMDL
jgi:putative transposase